MHQEIFGIIKSYGLMLATSFGLGLWLSIRRGRAHGITTEQMMDLVFAVLVSGLIGVRLFFVLTHLGSFEPWYRAFFVWDGGLTLYGGIILATVAVYLMGRRQGLAFLVLADILAPSVALGVGITRIGCFLSGCCYGRPTGLSGGIVFPAGAPATIQFGPVAVHPSQLYSSAAGFLICAILLSVERVWNYRSATFGRFLLLYGVSRFSVDFTRYYEPEQVMAFGWSNSQWISVALMIVGLAVMVWGARRARLGGV